MNILYKLESLLFCFHTFGVRRSIFVLDQENQPGSGLPPLTALLDTKYKTMYIFFFQQNLPEIIVGYHTTF